MQRDGRAAGGGGVLRKLGLDKARGLVLLSPGPGLPCWGPVSRHGQQQAATRGAATLRVGSLEYCPTLLWEYPSRKVQYPMEGLEGVQYPNICLLNILLECYEIFRESLGQILLTKKLISAASCSH